MDTIDQLYNEIKKETIKLTENHKQLRNQQLDAYKIGQQIHQTTTALKPNSSKKNNN